MQKLRRKKIVVSVINDLATDQRVKKVCQTLYENGFDIFLVGRKLKESLPVDDRPYKVQRMKLIFTKGPAFYVFYNIRLFFLLLFTRADVFHANDLDTLLPNFLVSKIRRKKLVYDSHELFTEVPELTSRPWVQSVWKRIEKIIFPRLKYVFTVNESIAGFYETKYGIKVNVLRNLPRKNISFMKSDDFSFGLDKSKKIIILQGAGINIDRGAEELVESLKYLEGIILVIAGDGDVISVLKEYVALENLKDKVIFYSKMPHERLMQLTRLADCGVTLDKDTNLNYRYSLPNKLFDYINACIPVLASDIPEIRKIVEEYSVGLIAESHDPQHLAGKLKEIVFEIPLSNWTHALQKASGELCWENEQHKLLTVYEQLK